MRQDIIIPFVEILLWIHKYKQVTFFSLYVCVCTHVKTAIFGKYFNNSCVNLFIFFFLLIMTFFSAYFFSRNCKCYNFIEWSYASVPVIIFNDDLLNEGMRQFLKRIYSSYFGEIFLNNIYRLRIDLSAKFHFLTSKITQIFLINFLLLFLTQLFKNRNSRRSSLHSSHKL